MEYNTPISLAIDKRLSVLWDAINTHADGADEEQLQLLGLATRAAYACGYHDGDYQHPAIEDDLDIDVRLAAIWSVMTITKFTGYANEIMGFSLRAAYCRGFDDGAGERPFGPAPQDRPFALNSPRF